MKQILILLILILVVACGTQPLAQPENDTLVEPVKLTSTSTVSTVKPNISPSSTLTKENSTEIIAEARNTTVPDNGITVVNYTFSLPQEVPDGLGPVKIIGWLPNNFDEVVVLDRNNVVAVNVFSGQTRQFSQPSDQSIRPESIRLLKGDRIAFTTYNPQVKKPDTVWISHSGNERTTKPIITGIHPYPVMTSDENSLIVYDINAKQTSLLNQDGTKVEAKTSLSNVFNILLVPRIEKDKYWNIQSASSPNSQWTAVFNAEYFKLVNMETGESRSIELKYQVEEVNWSSDGQKLAMLVSEGSRPISFMKLFVLDVNSEQTQEIETGFQYVQDASWAPNNEDLLITAITGEIYSEEKGYSYNTSRLFLVNLNTGGIELIDIIPKDSSMAYNWGIAWALDEQKIAVLARYPYPHTPQLYRVDVRLTGK